MLCPVLSIIRNTLAPISNCQLPVVVLLRHLSDLMCWHIIARAQYEGQFWISKYHVGDAAV
jgi:hypothetical protein